MKKGILIVATITIATLVGLIKVNASTYQNGYWTTFYSGSQLNYNTNTGYYWFNTTNFPRYIFFNSSTAQNGTGLAIPTNARSVSFNLRITTAELTGAPNTFSFGIYTDNSNLLFCDITSSANYNNVEMSYGLQYNFVVSCPINDEANRLTVIFVQGYDVPNGQAQAYQIQINPNFTFEINDAQDGTQAIIDNQDENTQEIINQNATYSDQPKEETEGKNETSNYEQKEEQLMGNLDFNMTAMDNISINPNASAFIWQIADALRSINPAIILLMTSILGMGLIKLILNR